MHNMWLLRELLGFAARQMLCLYRQIYFIFDSLLHLNDINSKAPFYLQSLILGKKWSNLHMEAAGSSETTVTTYKLA